MLLLFSAATSCSYAFNNKLTMVPDGAFEGLPRLERM